MNLPCSPAATLKTGTPMLRKFTFRGASLCVNFVVRKASNLPLQWTLAHSHTIALTIVLWWKRT